MPKDKYYMITGVVEGTRCTVILDTTKDAILAEKYFNEHIESDMYSVLEMHEVETLQKRIKV